MDKWLKRIWLVNGVGLLILLIITLFGYIIELLPVSAAPTGPMSLSPEASESADSTILQDVRPSLPVAVGRTDFVYIGLRVRDLEKSQSMGSYRTMKYYEDDASESNFTNLIFLRLNGADARLLLNRKAFISYAAIPGSDDSLRTINLFKIAFRDTDSDGRIGPGDSTLLYVSDLDGQHLTSVLPPDLSLEDHRVSDAQQRVFIEAAVRPTDPGIGREDWPHRLYIYDINKRVLHPYGAIDSTVAVAKQVLWDK